jgi:hypothetical protein
VLRLGADLILASAVVHPDFRVSVTELTPGSAAPLGELRVLANEGKLSRSPTITRTPRGFAVAWWEGIRIGESVRMAQFDCCVRPES